jgi:PAS domain S-box-containing protein
METLQTNIDFQALFASIVNYSDDAILSKSLDGIITSWNKGAERIFGYSSEEIIGKHISILIPPNLLDEEKEIIAKVRKGELVGHYETVRIRKGGNRINVSLTVSPIRDSSGNITGASKIARDITLRKKEDAELAAKALNTEKRTNELLSVLLRYTLMDFSQKAVLSPEGDELDAIAVGLNTMSEELESHIHQLKESEERAQTSQKIFSTVFYKSPVMNSITDATNGQFIEVNENFLKFCGYAKEEVVGRSSLDLNLIPHPAHREEIIAGIRAKGYSRDVVLEIQTQNGETKWVSTSAHAVNISGKDCFITAMVDITERKVAEEQLQMVNKELEAFSYSVSHDLRAPLRAVNGFAQMLKEEYSSKLDEEGKRILDVIKYNANKMGTLIDELLSFSRLGRKELQRTSVQMNMLVTDVLSEVGKSLPHSAEINLGQLHNIKGDQGLIRQVMVNLISNAVKYSYKKQNPVVHILSENKNGEIIFSVKDNGAGFDMRYANKLFGVFQRLHSQDEFEGTGVGLAIVQRIVTKHGGKVWAEGKINEGATFNFSLPAN